jgi:hypothetical protein
MWRNGRLGDTAVDRVLLLIAARSSTGTLTVQADDVLAVRFRRGEIIGADALKESLTHGLGRVLVAAGHLNRDQVAAIEAADHEGTVIDHLLASGLVPPDVLAGCVRQHTYLLLVRLLSWRAGEYNFYEGEVSWSLDPRPITVEELLVRASEEDPRLLGGTIPPLGNEMLRPLLGRRAFRVLSWQQEPGAADTGELWLTSLEDTLLRSLDGLTPSLEFRERLGVDEFRLRHALHRLHQAGLVTVVRAATSVEPASALSTAAVGSRAPHLAPASVPVAAVPEPSVAPEPEETAAARAARLTELGVLLSDLSRAFSYTLAAGLAILVLALVLAGGSMPRLHHPFPWQDAQRQRIESLRQASLHRDLTGRLKTYRILYGSFPLDLRPLVDTGLVHPRALRDGRGRDVHFEALEDGYVLGFEEAEEGDLSSQLRSRVAVAGDFLLDTEFTQAEGGDARGAVIQVLD